ncbi:hypothetical protein SE17_12300 [Kouleothrix aurantiaca]|uniref:histidine kinase n=1 Tax=Kouleothrix aurantiaca TaxID=186479 RepID=A0A0P9DRZ7_9CHLR|nr:hypothetical protein SE17_12300 [Kouleothrix aurantiaca]
MDTSSLHILLVEDDEDDYWLTNRMLKENGVQVQLDWASTYEQALDSVGRQQHDVYLIDPRLDQHTGLDVVRAVVQQGYTAALIVLTCISDQDTDREAMRAGAADYLVKSQISAETLERSIRYALAKAHMLATLHQNTTRYRMMTDVAPEAIISTNGSGTIIFANRAAEHIFGYSLAQLQGMQLAVLLPNATLQAIVPPHTSEEIRIVPQTIELSGAHQDGSSIALEMTLGIALEHGQYTQTMIFRDVTNRKRLGMQIAHVQEMAALGELASSIVHDFSNLLTAIKGYSEFLLDDFEQSDPRRSSAEEILHVAERGTRLTQQLLTFSRTQTVEAIDLELNALVLGLRPLIQQLAGSGIELAVQPAEAPLCIRAELSQIEQVILNLVVNAHDAMPHGGTLTIRTALIEPASGLIPGALPDRGSYAMLEVSDTGIGIDAATQKRIFELFFSTKAPGKGTGIGLTASHRIIQHYGGAISVASEPGQGARFRVFLPCADTAVSAPRGLAPATEHSPAVDVSVAPDAHIVTTHSTTSLSMENLNNGTQSGHSRLVG